MESNQQIEENGNQEMAKEEGKLSPSEYQVQHEDKNVSNKALAT